MPDKLLGLTGRPRAAGTGGIPVDQGAEASGSFPGKARSSPVWRHRRDTWARRWSEAGLLPVVLVVVGVLFALRLNPGDVQLYRHYAERALASPLFHSLPREYPALSVVIFLLPAAAGSAYLLVFALLAASATLALLLSSDGLADHPGWSWRASIYFLAGALAVLFGRYDIFPVLCAVLALEGARHGRWGRAWAWAVLGGLLKLFPFLLLPGFLLSERRATGKWPLRRLAGAAVPLALAAVAQVVAAPGSLLSPLRYEANRGLELSSLQGSLALLVDPLHQRWAYRFATTEILGTDHALIGAVVMAAALVALVAVWWLAYRGRLGVEAISLAVLTVAVLGDKAFAAQYLIWLVPFWAYWPLRAGWLSAAALTMLVYPLLYMEAFRYGPGYYLPTIAAAVRNAVLIVATARWLHEQLKASVPAGATGALCAAPTTRRAVTGTDYAVVK